MSAPAAQPPTWTVEELEEQRQASIADFIAERTAEGGEAYRRAFAQAHSVVKHLFAATDNLLTLATGRVLVAEASLVDAARYLAGPPISADDLRTLADASTTRRALDPETAERISRVIMAGLDRDRMPWVAEIRDPTSGELDTAERWTAGLWAAQRTATRRRGEAATRQQEHVRALLHEMDLREVAPRRIDVGADLGRGEFTSESLVAGTKCDVPVGLENGRLLLLECKVSSSAVNSVKRLNRETAGKAGRWRSAFGAGAFTGAVLAGVFKLHNLIDAQEQGVYIFWERDLRPLAKFVEASRTAASAK